MNILITGANGSLGQAFINRCPQHHKLYSHSRLNHENKFDIFGDISTVEFSLKLESFLEEKKIDIFVNNAALYNNSPIENINDADIVNLVSTNLTGQILMLKRVFSYFKVNRQGIIINLNSLAGKFPSKNESVYSATKFGIYGFSKVLQLEAIEFGIKVIDIFPGSFKSQMTKSRENFTSLIEPSEIADLVFHLVDNSKTQYTNEIILRRS
jgi:short-subunit dehydrogenase